MIEKTGTKARKNNTQTPSNLQVEVLLDDGQRDVVVRSQAGQVAEAELEEHAVDFGAQVLRHVDDRQGRRRGRLRNDRLVALQSACEVNGC